MREEKDELQPLMKAAEVAEALHVSRRQLARYLAAGLIPAVRFGRSIRFRPEDVERIRREGFDAARPQRGRPRKYGRRR